MSMLEKLDGLRLESAELTPVSPDTLRISGTITLHDPERAVLPYLEQVHRAVQDAGLREYNVDITALTFVNSSAIRLFVDWVTWATERDRPYRLVFITDPSRTWQRIALSAIQSLAGDGIEIRQGNT